MKKAKVTNDACVTVRSQVVFRNGIRVPFSQVINPKMKKSVPIKNKETK